MVAGAVGDLWFTRIGDSTLNHLKVDGDVDSFPLPVNIGTPINLQLDPLGNLWFSTTDQDPILWPTGRMSPAGQLTQFDGTTPFFANVSDQADPPVAFLPLARVNKGGTAEVIGINADGSPSFFNLPSGYTPNSSGGYLYRPVAVVIGPDQAFWYTDGDGIARLTREGQFSRFALPDPGAQASTLAVGGDGNLWFAETHYATTIDSPLQYAFKLGRMTTGGTLTEYNLAHNGEFLQLSNFSTSADGSIWYSQQGIRPDGFHFRPNSHIAGRIGPDGLITSYIFPANNSELAFSTVSRDGNFWTSTAFLPTPGQLQSSVVQKIDITSLPVGGVIDLNTSGGPHGRALLGRLTLPSPGGLQASVDLGDGSAVPAALADNGDGTFAVSAAVDYHVSGDYPVTVTVTDLTGIQAQLHGFAHVTPGPNELYVDQLYVDLLGRTPDHDGLAFWVTNLDNGLAPAAVSDLFTHSDEYYALNVIEPAYREFLGREADDAGLAFWVARMRAGLTDQQVRAAFVGSAEFFANAGGANAQWVDAMYQSLLGRVADPEGKDFWVGVLAAGVSRADVALGFTGSVERARFEIQATYLRYLGRPADQEGEDFWVNAFKIGLTIEDIITGFLGSPEYFQGATG